jgi:3-deoxy-D-manno-octulosonic acid hydroxylase-like protein
VTNWIEVQDFVYPRGFAEDARVRSRWCCEQLEASRVLYFPRPPFEFSDDDRDFLVSQRRANSSVHKNISYRPARNIIRGFEGSPEVLERLTSVMSNYSRAVESFVRQLLAPYDAGFKLDFASFRPIEEEGRALPIHKRNDLLHVDAFPSRPTHGGRILRVFTNIHPTKPRVWNVGEQFSVLAGNQAQNAGLARFAEAGGTSRWAAIPRAFGAPIPHRSAYDRFMLHFHDYLKENATYQTDSPKTRMEFPPMATWLVYTDGVPHSVLGGQHALEQTFIISRAALVAPEVSPIGVLEKLCGRPLAAAAHS